MKNAVRSAVVWLFVSVSALAQTPPPGSESLGLVPAAQESWYSEWYGSVGGGGSFGGCFKGGSPEEAYAKAIDAWNAWIADKNGPQYQFLGCNNGNLNPSEMSGAFSEFAPFRQFAERCGIPGALTAPDYLGRREVVAGFVASWNYYQHPYPPRLSCVSQQVGGGAKSDGGAATSFRCPAGYIYATAYGRTVWCRPDPTPRPERDKFAACRAPSAPSAMSVGDPASATSAGDQTSPPGNHYQVEIDYRGGLSLVRYYNSANTPARSGFGWRWRHHWERSLQWEAKYSINALRHDGGILNFRLVNGVWTPDADVTDRLTVYANIYTGAPYAMTYYSEDGDEESYDGRGRLLSIKGPTGIVNTLSYSNGTLATGAVLDANGQPTTTPLPAGLLTRVSDAYGRVFQFGYDALSQITRATNPRGGVAEYAYDARDTLTGVTYPTGAARAYHYDEPEHAGGAGPRTLTGITIDGVRTATIDYDAQGRSIPPASAMDTHLSQIGDPAAATVFGLASLGVLAPPCVRCIPPPGGTMGTSQPPAGHANPVPPGSRDRPDNRPDRPGSDPAANDPSFGGGGGGGGRDDECYKAAQKCFDKLQPDVKVQQIIDWAKGLCPLPLFYDAPWGGLPCMKSLQQCLAGLPTIFPGGGGMVP